MTLIPLHVTIQHEVGTGCGNRLHDPALVVSRDDEPVLRCVEQIAPSLAILALGEFVQKIGLIQVDDSHQGANHGTCGIVYRHGNAKYGVSQYFALGGAAHHRFILIEGSGNSLPVHEVDADTTA